MKNKLTPIIAIISSIGLAACGGDSSSNASENTPEENISSTNTGNSSSSFSGSTVKPSSVKTGSLTDERDGQTYKTVQIGNQIWMAENLKLEVSDGFCYGDVKANCEKYGTFYTAKTALRICPDGWKLPNDEAWKILAQNIGAEYDESGRSGGGTFFYINDDAISKIRSTTGWTNTNGINALGFSAYPAGKFNGTQYSGLGEQAAFMGSNKSSGEDDSWAVISENQIYITGGKLTNSAMPVRCLQELPCDDSNNGEVKGVTICKKGEWRVGTDVELTTGFKNCNNENRNEIIGKYICTGSYWREGSDTEISKVFKVCDLYNAHELVNGFVCDKSSNFPFDFEWLELTDIEKKTDFKISTIDNRKCTRDNDGETVNNHTCIGIEGFWRSADPYISLGSMSWEEAKSSCPVGWKIPSSSCDENSPSSFVELKKNSIEDLDLHISWFNGYACGDGLNLNYFHWTSSEINDSLAFAVVYNDNRFEEYAAVLPKTEKSALATSYAEDHVSLATVSFAIVAICVKE